MIILGVFPVTMLHSPLLGFCLNGRQHQNKVYYFDLNVI